MDNTTLTVNATLPDPNGTTIQGTTPLPATPPPPGYYGDTKEVLWKVIPPIIMVWGTVGNLLTILVLLRQVRKLSSTAMYLMALAISDTIVLFTGPLRQWLIHVWDYDVRHITDAGCRIQIYITYASLHCSSWLLVAVTLERAISVVLPHKVKLGCTPRTAAGIIFAIVLFTFGINIINLVINGIDSVRASQKCAPTTQEYLDFRNDVYQWIDFLVAFAVPFVLLLVGNIVIIAYLQKSRANQKSMAAARGQGGATSGRDTQSVSVLLIALCAIFFITMTPASVFGVYSPYRINEIFELFKTDPYRAWYDYQYFEFLHAVVNLVSYTNASFNFILYVFSGTKFRKELRAMFHCDTAGTSGVFGSKVTKSSSQTRNTSISTKMGQKSYFSKKTESVKDNDIQTEPKSNADPDNVDKKACEKEEIVDHSSTATKHTEKERQDSTKSDYINADDTTDNKENRENELNSTAEQKYGKETDITQEKRDEDISNGNKIVNECGETLSLNEVSLEIKK